MKGKLDLPGGFVDPGETAEEAVKRELKEELNLEIQNLTFFTTDQNSYFFKGITYRTCDVCYITEINTTQFVIDDAEIQGLKWLKPSDIRLEDIGFDSLRRVIKKYIETL